MSVRQERALEIVHKLRRIYPRAKCSLDFKNPFQLLISTMLSAQTTDAKVNEVAKSLYRAYPGPQELAAAKPSELETMIRSTGYFRNKAKAIQGASLALVERHQCEVPATMDELTALPGVGRKTANVVLANAFGIASGVVVDTHVARLSLRLGLTRHDDPPKIEHDLMKLIPEKEWTKFAHRMILHGREVCHAKTPKCGDCLINELCPSARTPLE
ncbi:MAG: endonuclease III [Acidobacteria bacterium]|nr:endonuclease III [Acidobacteriota bacterium]